MASCVWSLYEFTRATSNYRRTVEAYCRHTRIELYSILSFLFKC